MALGAFSLLASCDSGGDTGNGTSVAGQPGAGAPTSGAGAPTSSAGAPTSGAGAPTSGAGAPTSGAGAGGASAGAAGHAGAATSGGASGAASGGSAGAMTQAGAPGSAGAQNTGPQPLDKITGGTQGFASRYWDCCKPSCGGSNLSCNKGGTAKDGGGSACSGGSAYMCWNFDPWVDPANKYVAYAFAASKFGCGGCYELQFSGKSGCSDSTTCPATGTKLLYNTIYVQVINTGSDLKDNQFDLLIPGGGVGLFNACSAQWGVDNSQLGAQYGGFLDGCNGVVTCVQDKCKSVFGSKPDLLAGCNWFVDWLGAIPNPQINYKKVTCPSQLKDKSGISG